MKARILIAEDNLINQMVASELLKAEGHDVSVAGNGVEAIEAVRQGQFDIVLMDCQMPEMDGYEATAKINEEAARGVFRRPTIIALTANAVSGDRERCLEAGMDDYVAKPIDRGVLMRKIAQAMEAIGASSTVTEPMPVAHPTTTAVADDAPIIAEQLLQRCMSNATIAMKVLDLFTQTYPTDAQRLAAAVTAGDARQTRELAHRIKGGAGQIAAVKLQAIAAELEGMAKAGDLTSAQAQIIALQAELERCLQRVPQLTQEISS